MGLIKYLGKRKDRKDCIDTTNLQLGEEKRARTIEIIPPPRDENGRFVSDRSRTHQTDLNKDAQSSESPGGPMESHK